MVAKSFSDEDKKLRGGLEERTSVSARAAEKAIKVKKYKSRKCWWKVDPQKASCVCTNCCYQVYASATS